MLASVNLCFCFHTWVAFTSRLSRSSAVATATASSVGLQFSDAGSWPATSQTPFVVLHGLLGAGSNFQTWAARLGDDCAAKGAARRVLLVDLRNHGSSDKAATMSFVEMAADVRRLLDEQGIPKAILCGHSLGGKVAMALALQSPERVERLVVLDMAPVTYETGEGSPWAENVRIIDDLLAIDLQRISSKRDADAALARGVSDPGLRAFLLTNLVRRSGGQGFAWRVNLRAIADSLGELARWEVGGEVYGGNALFVAGGQSRYVRSSYLAAISEQFSTFSLSTIRSAGHWIHADEPDALLLIISSFLDVPPSRRS
mmetsp:Transcript_13775/g.43722  ORF Transcript_13775/g.43722 Transcript_13775/m.43722 type:complete len:315 (+) Transcript_13775:31-975(+)